MAGLEVFHLILSDWLLVGHKAYSDQPVDTLSCKFCNSTGWYLLVFLNETFGVQLSRSSNYQIFFFLKGCFNKITFHTKIKIFITYFLVLFYFIIFLLTNTYYLLTGDDFDVGLCG